ncbi:putative NmrA-like family-containing protein 1 [Venustampulla echinocandica]|uniref:Putative NmrA-like family-containing protein 1 n=1 Tax=Venustampulla echinocandica TaxID=2656787 RepID=A0A370TJA3_9HELO|nr:putative NmrA-like family-containing protein 1 [Venustampulla echinocandica]RDL35435.1 putative NmrA-like family-containing protein 1 [Venustampulla echinocandica]
MSKPLIVVVGATGAQGGSVVSAFLSDGTYQIRAITRRPHSPKAKVLQDRGVEVVSADLNNEASLVEAFKGATAIFAVTDFFEPFISSGPEVAVQVETAQGINLARAAAQTSTLKHYIWSTLPNASQISGGKYVIPHFDSKNKIDAFIKDIPALYEKTTFLWLTWFASNVQFPVFRPALHKPSGKHVLLQPVPQNTPILSIGDQVSNVGHFALSIVKQPDLTLPAKFVLASTDSTTTGDLLKTWGKVTGKETEYLEISLEQYERFFPRWGTELGMMMQYWAEVGDKSWSGEAVLTRQTLGIDAAFVGTEKALGAVNWNED